MRSLKTRRDGAAEESSLNGPLTTREQSCVHLDPQSPGPWEADVSELPEDPDHPPPPPWASRRAR